MLALQVNGLSFCTVLFQLHPLRPICGSAASLLVRLAFPVR